jgi:predicted AAA+ superfamily ATPase
MSEIIQKPRVLSDFLPSSKKKRLVLLTGARQTGKTTLALRKYPDLGYISLDAPENREAIRGMPIASWSRSVGNAVIDEAQKEPSLFEKVKFAFDRGDISFSLLLGSSQILLLKKIRESLAGRISVYELWPLLMGELTSESDTQTPSSPLLDRLFSNQDLKRIFRDVPDVLLVSDNGRIQEAEKHLLQWGGMPALLPLPAEERWKWLKDYQFTYLERDLGDLARLDDLVPFRIFQKLAALRSARLLNYSELARDASLSVDTARRYLEYLTLSYQTALLQPYHRNITSSVIKTPKLYWLDIGIVRSLSGFRGDLSGEIYETMVVSEIIKWMKTVQRQEEIYFYRTRSGLELDILLLTEKGIIGMEIKARTAVASTDLRAMREVAKGLGKEWRGGLVIYLGNTIQKVGEPNVWAVPSRRLFTST